MKSEWGEHALPFSAHGQFLLPVGPGRPPYSCFFTAFFQETVA